MVGDFSTVGVVGLGTMGAGIVEVFARAGLQVLAFEPDPAAVERGRGHLWTSTDRAVRRGKLTETERGALVDRVLFTSTIEDLAPADLVIEAVPEVLSLKRQVFQGLEAVIGPETVLATNTSSLSVAEIAASTGRPRFVVGMHFFNPAPLLRLVEVVDAPASDADVVAAVAALARRLGKTPVVIGDRVGFIANWLLFGYLNQAVGLLASGTETREGIDAALANHDSFPMGPLALLDLIGLDTSLHILEAMHADSGKPRHAPDRLLADLVHRGWLGRKTGRGFFTYGAPGSAVVVGDEETGIGATTAENTEDIRGSAATLVETLLSAYLQDACEMADDGYATPQDIDTAMTLGCGFPTGPFALMATRRALR